MDPIALQGKVAYGYGKAGLKLGPAHAWYRPQGTGPVIVPANQLGSLPFAASATAKGDFARPATDKTVDWFALVDTSQTAVADYLAGPTGTWFIAEQGLLSAPVVTRCDRELTGLRAAENSAPASTGLQTGYGGDTTAEDLILFAGWPGRIVVGGGRAEGARVTLPGNTKMAGLTAVLPPIPGVVLRADDRITDDLGGDFLVSDAVLSIRGWTLLLIDVAA